MRGQRRAVRAAKALAGAAPALGTTLTEPCLDKWSPWCLIGELCLAVDWQFRKCCENAHSDAVCGAAPAERAATLGHPWHRPFLFSILHTFVCWRAKMILYKQGVDDEGPARVDPLACQNRGTWIEGFAELDVLAGISAPVGDFLLDSAERQALERLRPVRSDGPYHGSWHSYIYSDGVASFLDAANDLLFLLARGGFPPDSGGELFLAF